MLHKLLSLLVLCFFVVACDGRKKEAKSLEKAIETSTGQLHTIVKMDTEQGDYVVYKNEATGEYVAYNMAKWDRESMSTMEQYAAAGAVDGIDIVRNLASNTVWVNSGYWDSVYHTWTETNEYYDHMCDCYETETITHSEYVGERWVDTSHYYTYYTGGGFSFENTSSASKDLETIAALKDEAAEAFMAHRLQSELQLSSNRAAELAKLANRYQKLENARELTGSEKDKFAMDALGVSMTQVEAAMKAKAEGKEARYEELLKTAAEVNSTSPESIGKFFEEMGTEI